jgi:hypothetical protein
VCPHHASSQPAYYSDGATQVLLGDHVQLRVFFRRRVGQVTYVPGISRVNAEMEHDGLTWVGIQVVNGPTVGMLVDPFNRLLEKGVTFLDRGELVARAPIQPGDRVFED